jgi:hypothetical protein
MSLAGPQQESERLFRYGLILGQPNMTSPPLLIAMLLTLLASAFFIGVNALRRPQKLLRGFDLIAETAGAHGEIRAI